MNKIFVECMAYLIKFRRFVSAGIIGIALVVMIGIATSSNLNPMAGAYGAYNDQTENKELLELLNTYYKAYDENDVDTLKKVAAPISDHELSYIALMSEQIDSHTIEKLYTKDGSEKGSLLVSVKVQIKYSSLDTPAPGLDFFYVEKKDDKYQINNTYSLFNLQNGDTEVDGSIASLIAVFEAQEDVVALQKEVQAEHEKLMLSNADYNAFFTTSIRETIAGWASSYETELAEKKAEEEKKAAEEAEAKKAKEEEAKKAEEEKKEEEKKEAEKKEEEKKTAEEENTSGDAASAQESDKNTVRATAKVNVRKSASRSASSLGQVKKGTELEKLGKDGEWTKVDYNGTTGYIMSEYLEEVSKTTETADDEEEKPAEEAEENKKKTTETAEENTAEEGTAANFKKGDQVMMSDAVNVRMEMDEHSKIVAVAYAGLKVDIIKVYANGWTEVGIDGKTGYMKTDLIR